MNRCPFLKLVFGSFIMTKFLIVIIVFLLLRHLVFLNRICLIFLKLFLKIEESYFNHFVDSYLLFLKSLQKGLQSQKILNYLFN